MKEEEEEEEEWDRAKLRICVKFEVAGLDLRVSLDAKHDEKRRMGYGMIAHAGPPPC